MFLQELFIPNRLYLPAEISLELKMQISGHDDYLMTLQTNQNNAYEFSGLKHA